MIACCLNIFSANAQNSSDAKIDLAPTPPIGGLNGIILPLVLMKILFAK